MNKIKAKCPVCKFSLTKGNAEIGDICPWCKRGILELPTPKSKEEK